MQRKHVVKKALSWNNEKKTEHILNQINYDRDFKCACFLLLKDWRQNEFTVERMDITIVNKNLWF
jgi:hypothetical protein